MRQREGRGQQQAPARPEREQEGELELDTADDRTRATANAHHDLQRIADEGVAGADQELPHRAAIEQAIGKDLSGVRAQVGGAAVGAAATLGAQAYASGDRIAFASQPDVHTAAHEAAHVIQNQAGPGRGGGLTTPGDAHEQHADRVADQVVAGQPAGLGAIAVPAGTGAIARKPAPVQAPADAAAAMTELKAQLDAGITQPARIALLVRMLSDDDKVKVRDDDAHWDAIEKACTAAQVITIAELLDITPVGTIQIGLAKGAKPAELAGPLRRLDSADLVIIGEDPQLFADLRKLLPGPVQMRVAAFHPYDEVAKSEPWMRWLVESNSPMQLWRTISGITDKAAIATTFDQADDLWDWVSKLPASTLTMEDVRNLQDYSSATGRADISDRISALAKAGPQPIRLGADATEAEHAAARKHEDDARAAGKAELDRVLAERGELSVDRLMTAASNAGWGAKDLATDASARKRIIAKLDPEQLAELTRTLNFSAVQRIEWLLDKKTATATQLWEPMQALDEAELTAVFGKPARLKALHARVAGDIPNLLVVVNRSEVLQKLALEDDLLRAWILGAGSAEDVFGFVTMGKSAESIAKACKLIAAQRGFQWVYELGNLESSSTDLRRLAMALPDRAAAKHLMTHGVRDFPLQPGIESAPVAPPAGMHDSAGTQIETATKADDGEDIAENAAELTDAERTAIRRDRELVGKAIASSASANNLGDDAVRTARELDGNLAETIRAIENEVTQIDRGSFRTYARERSAAEQVAVASDPKLAALADRLLFYNLFNALPGLRPPDSLAKALEANPKLIDWITTKTHPIEALMKLGATPAVAEAAAKAFELHGVQLIRALPNGGLTVEQKTALMRIGANATAGKLHEAVSDRLEVDPDDDRSAEADLINGTKPLRDRIDEMIASKGTETATQLQAICNSRPISEVRDVFADKQAKRIDFLRTTLSVSPLTVFPRLAEAPIPELFTNRHVLGWMMATEEAVALLRTIGNTPVAIGPVAAAIENKDRGATRWLDHLPSGFGLSASDEAVLHRIYREVTSDEGALAVFTARFGHAPEGDWSRDGLNKMWTTLARLPDRQVEGNAKFGGLKLGGAVDGAGGTYSPSTGVITIADEDAGGGDSRYAKAKWQSKEQLAKQLGVDEVEIDKRVAAKTVETQTVKGELMYRLKEQPGGDWTYTLLHETGHAVDAMLGNQTELVFGLAGWKTYGSAEFDAWATEMKAFEGATVSAEDREEIRIVFEQHLRSSSAIHGPGGIAKLVTGDHPLRKSKNQNAFICKTVKHSDRAFMHTSPTAHDGRLFHLNHYYGRYMSYDAKIHDILPLPYAGFAPQEFFAECYVEYYRDEQNKGGNLPTWIKAWFDQNVDNIGHGPVKTP